ncbi:Mor transcription activator family protein [Chromobacterium sp. IIBBL 290-4]|uniref:Mor transcription activator family protein n=1 Tax=Chromobacterium sp. IIBBL 290-4 TaxID=2953890 RepID=UPI0020B8A795|nr:Mor transcription activator family protein [Chromobacterium sp. IIBBL 290-4]UTH76082.1 DNA-binding protein [Chromobacterium sp. IIBBL 290-4]
MNTSFRSKGPELLADLTDHITEALKQLAHTESRQAEKIAQEITRRMTQHWGGQNIYFPLGKSTRSAERDQRILQEFTGANHAELAQKHGISVQWVYKIIKNQRQTSC